MGSLEENSRHDDGCVQPGQNSSGICEPGWVLKGRTLQRNCISLHSRASLESRSSAHSPPCPCDRNLPLSPQGLLAQRMVAPYVLLVHREEA